MSPEEEIPPAAIDAVLAAARSRCGCGSFHEYDCHLGQLDREDAAVLLKAARPHIAAAERERLQDSMPSITIQVADGGSISAGQWQELGEQLAAACRYQIASAVQAERERIIAQLGNEHHVNFGETGWSVEHSVECRLSGQPLHECEYHKAVERIADSMAREGRWLITVIDSEGLPGLKRAEPGA